MKKIWLGLILIFTFSGLVAAQQKSDENYKGEVFIGYSGSFDFADGGSLRNGFDASAVYNFRRYIGVKGDVSATKDFNDTSTFQVSGGVQFKDNSKKDEKRVKPFGHVMAGFGNQSNYGDGVSVIVGGGVDIKVNDKIDIRAVQYDINPIIITRTNGVVLNNRISAGIVFKF